MMYRLYKLANDGHLFGMPEVIEASDDKNAIEKATQCVDGHDLELWDHRRRVAVIPSKDK
jgi:hypothetical protein